MSTNGPDSVAAALPASGEVLDGKYRVEGTLGRGGIGAVLAAHHLALDRKVAIKLLLHQTEEGSEQAQRFAREARVTAQLQGEHVARVLDVGELPSGAPYIVMEYLEGSDLRSQREKGLAVETIVDYALQAAEGLAEAHARNIVHRDLKPGNLFLAKRPDGSQIVKVVDFGLSKYSGGDQGSLTHTAALMGSPRYMAPEQLLSSKHVDARADIWSLGAVLYELLAGQNVTVHG